MRRPVVRDSSGWITSYDGVPVRKPSEFRKLKPGMVFSCVNLKGCNGSGKSTVPIQFIKHSQASGKISYVVLSRDDKKPVATFCEEFNLIIVGLYLPGTNCGGCDSVGNTDLVKDVLAAFWVRRVNIMFEGVIVGDIKSTFYELMKAFAARVPRNISFCFMGTKFSECLRRIQKRNGGKDIKEDLVKAKYRNSMTHLQYYLEQGDVDCQVLDTRGPIPKVFHRFCQLYPDFNPIF